MRPLSRHHGFHSEGIEYADLPSAGFFSSCLIGEMYGLHGQTGPIEAVIIRRPPVATTENVVLEHKRQMIKGIRFGEAQLLNNIRDGGFLFLFKKAEDGFFLLFFDGVQGHGLGVFLRRVVCSAQRRLLILKVQVVRYALIIIT